MSLPIIPGPNNELITQSLAIPPQYPTHYWGSWYSTQNQTASFINTAYPVTVNTLNGTNGFYISGSDGSTVSGSVIVIPKYSLYDFQFSLQLYNTGGGGSTSAVDIWLRVNGNDVPYSTTKVAVTAVSPFVVAAWDFMGEYNKGDKLELMWATNNTGNQIYASAPISPAPAIPSTIFTIMEL